MNVNDIINSVGAMAEITALFFGTLLKNGVEKDTAAFLTSEFIGSIIKNITGKGNDD